jgi:hypothetical protein
VPPVSRAWKKFSSSTSWRLGVVADEDDVDLLVVPGQEQVQQDEEALGQLLAPSSIEPETSIRQNITALLVGTGTRTRLR